jgi:hypothetical protein
MITARRSGRAAAAAVGLGLLVLSSGCAGLRQAVHAGGGRLRLAQAGKTEYVIVSAAAPTAAEIYAVQELAAYLGRVTGATFNVLPESGSLPAAPRLYVGQTAFAAARGIDLAALGDEEWVIRTVGADLLIAGGRPRGTLYGVYDFLERQVGCHWLDEDTEVVPAMPTLELPALKRRAQPAFWMRSIYALYAVDTEKTNLFCVRNLGNSPDRGGLGARYGFGVAYGTPGGCHTFAAYAANFPKDRPELLSMDAQGKRVGALDGSGPGGICLMHPEVRRLVLDRLREFIVKDRAAAASAGTPPPRVYDISQNDNHWMCQCPDCKAVSAREGSESGPLIDFINAIADGIRPEYPEVLVMTFAYSITETPPKTLKPRANVIIRIAELNAEWGRESDLFHPLTHPVNAAQFGRLQAWSKIATSIAAWDYWIQYSPNDKFPTPYAPVSCIPPDLATFHRYGVRNVFVECESPDTTSFFALKRWLGYQCMQDPSRPAEPLLQTFMAGYFGPAAATMRQYLQFLQERSAAAEANLSALENYDRPYLTLDFYLTCERLLDQAEALCSGAPQALLHVRRERIPVDGGFYHMWPQVTRDLPAGQALPGQREDLLKRYEAYRLEQLVAVHSAPGQAKGREDLAKEIQGMRDSLVVEQRRQQPPPQVSIPKAAAAQGDPARVDWAKARELAPWYRVSGADTEQKLKAWLIHDGQYLYIKLEHACDSAKLVRADDLWSGDDWELFFAPQRGQPPYWQLALDPNGRSIGYEWQAMINKGKPKDWNSGARIVSTTAADLWTVVVSFPLATLLPGGVRAGQPFYADFYRCVMPGRTFLAWSPPFDETFHSLARLPELRLE